jgi:uncharacterized UBP type Zn finger protein
MDAAEKKAFVRERCICCYEKVTFNLSAHVCDECLPKVCGKEPIVAYYKEKEE